MGAGEQAVVGLLPGAGERPPGLPCCRAVNPPATLPHHVAAPRARSIPASTRRAETF